MAEYSQADLSSETGEYVGQAAPDSSDERPVLFQRDGRVAYVTLNRPARLNAMNRRMHIDLKSIWDTFEEDDDLHICVLRGAGDRSFSVGQDLKDLVTGTRDCDSTSGSSTFGSYGEPGWPRLTERFSLSKPVLAQVDGYAFGGGFELALAADIIIATDNSLFALPESRLGLVPGAGGVFRLVRQIPFKVALGYLMTGRRMSAARAFDLGLVNEVVPPAELDTCTEEWVQDLLRCAPLSLRAIKEAALKSVDISLPEAFATRYSWEEKRRGSTDAMEGPRAFVENREPKWGGH